MLRNNLLSNFQYLSASPPINIPAGTGVLTASAGSLSILSGTGIVTCNGDQLPSLTSATNLVVNVLDTYTGNVTLVGNYSADDLTIEKVV